MNKSEIKSLKMLQNKKHRDEQKSFIVEGKRSVVEVLKQNCKIDLIIINHEIVKKEEKLIDQIKKKSIRLELVSSKELEAISSVEHSQGILAIVKYLQPDVSILFTNKNEKSKVVLLDNISDPGNMGTIIRTVDWFGLDALIITGNSVDIYNPKVVRSTMGSLFHIPIFIKKNTLEIIKKLKEKDFIIIAADLKGEQYNQIKYPNKSAIVFGNEAHGISSEIKPYVDKFVTIPGRGQAESLNVAISVGIILSQINS